MTSFPSISQPSIPSAFHSTSSVPPDSNSTQAPPHPRRQRARTRGRVRTRGRGCARGERRKRFSTKGTNTVAVNNTMTDGGNVDMQSTGEIPVSVPSLPGLVPRSITLQTADAGGTDTWPRTPADARDEAVRVRRETVRALLRRRAELLFDRFKSDGGRLDLQDFMDALRLLRLKAGPSYHDAIEIFQRADGDGDGRLSLKEFLECILN